eukprot:Amastigsp_a847039_18.p1 type:complete len:193 gc:universal Amastigsp_a847039_18:47-625(+)
MALHNMLHRGNMVVSTGFMYLFFLLIAIWAAGFMFNEKPSFQVELGEVVMLTQERFMPFLPEESKKSRPLERDVCNMTLNIRADLRSLFAYNTKEVFAFITAEWRTKKHPTNQMVIWDRIMLDPSEAVFEFNGTAIEYLLTDHGHNFRGAELTLTASWNTIPFTGQLFWGSDPRTTRLTLPTAYTHNPIIRR